MKRLRAYTELCRMHKPVGFFLLLWPMLIALFVAAHSYPSWKVLGIFVIGCFLMRSAGCAINDFADRNYDGFVARTKHRPLATKTITPVEALMVFGVLGFFAFMLVLATNKLTIYLSFVGLLLASVYPFLKRFTHLPQFFLGAAFAWAVPMAYTAVSNTLPGEVWWLYTATLLWAVAYDTQYALVDKSDDVKIGVKSTAQLFGQKAPWMILLFQGLTLGALFIYAYAADVLGVFVIIALLLGAVISFYQYGLVKTLAPQKCFKAFLNNQWLGLIWFLGFFFQICIL